MRRFDSGQGREIVRFDDGRYVGEFRVRLENQGEKA